MDPSYRAAFGIVKRMYLPAVSLALLVVLLLAVFVVAPALPLIKIGWDSSRASLVGRTLVAR